jgi:hypothetical protein
MPSQSSPTSDVTNPSHEILTGTWFDPTIRLASIPCTLFRTAAPLHFSPTL